VPRILLANDDGIAAEGLRALHAALEGLGELWVVAPETEQSATSHALSLHRPLRIRQHAERWYGIDGTPADCVYLAVHQVLKDVGPPDLVVSGINHGPNLADDVIYSGTVAAAMEGSILGFPSVAFSLVSRSSFDFEQSARFARALVAAALTLELPRRLLLNVNIPKAPATGWEVTRLGHHSYGARVVESEDPRGRKYYWLGGTGYEHRAEPGTDVTAVHDFKRVSVTPMMTDLTETALLPFARAFRLEGFSQHSG
jgi:5'-nucleotidase